MRDIEFVASAFLFFWKLVFSMFVLKFEVSTYYCDYFEKWIAIDAAMLEVECHDTVFSINMRIVIR